MKNARRKLKAKLDRSRNVTQINAVHDILNMMEVKYAKAELALTEIKMLCTKKK